MARIASSWRMEDAKLKTQIRFMKNYICLFTKTKGMDEPFVEMDMREVEEKEKLPEIEHWVSWRKGTEKPTWRRTSPVIREVQLKSLGGGRLVAGGRVQTSNSSNRTDTNQRIRHRYSSGSNDRVQRKK